MPLAHPSTRALPKGGLLVGIYHGTWTGGFLGPRGTSLDDLVDLIDKDMEDAHIISILGIGANGSLLDKYIGGFLGMRLVCNAVEAYKRFAQNYHEATNIRGSDRILMICFSRGCATALKTTKLIEAVGLPRRGDEALYTKLYKLCSRDTYSADEIRFVKEGYQWIEDVHIAELALFDTVTTHGVPKTGVGRALRVFPTWSTRSEHMMVVPSNVDHVSHVLMSHDPRAAFEPTLLCIPSGSTQVLRQVWFAGRHSDAMNTGTLAFMVDCLRTDLDIQFHEARMQARFSGPLDWVYRFTKPVNRFILAGGGNKPRMPAQHTLEGMLFNEEVHPSIRIRGYAYNHNDITLHGFHVEWDFINRTYSWVQDGRTRRSIASAASTSSSDADGNLGMVPPLRVGEYVPTQREKTLSGLND